MSNDFELADDDRRDLIYTKEQLMAPLLRGMEAPPHAMRLGDDEKDYYVREPHRVSPDDPAAGARGDQPVPDGAAGRGRTLSTATARPSSSGCSARSPC